MKLRVPLSCLGLLAAACTSTPPPGGQCDAGLQACADQCIDPVSDPLNCGGCGQICPAGQGCTSGVCCPAGLTNCSGSCVDLQRSLANCGACGQVCTSGQVCSNAECGATCLPSEELCLPLDGGASYCALVSTDNGNCGGCGVVCPGGQVCSSGQCALTCQQGTLDCGGTCVDPLTNNAHCGAQDDCLGNNAGTPCGAGQICSGGTCGLSCGNDFLDCGGTCVDPQTSNVFCGATGACGQGSGDAGVLCPAGELCSAGSCGLSCQSGLLDCVGTCTDPLTSRAFCGATGNCGAGGVGAPGKVCASGFICVNGACEASCTAGYTACTPDGGTSYCADLLVDALNCGACGTACASGQKCNGDGGCAETCTAGFTACTPADGGAPYCANLTDDVNNCGACGAPCAGTCGLGLCCPLGDTVCSGSGGPYCALLAEDSANCGQCGRACPGACAGAHCYPLDGGYSVGTGTLTFLDACDGGVVVLANVAACTTGIPLPLPFSLTFFGVTYGNFDPSADGYVMLTGSGPPGVNCQSGGTGGIPSPNLPGPALLPYNVDLVQRGGVCFQTFGAAPGRRFAIETNDAFLSSDSSADLTFEAVLNEADNSIDFVYATLSDDAGTATGAVCSVGLNNDGGTEGATYEYFDAGTLAPGLDVHFAPQPLY
jgi:hypothetical protein